MQNVKNTFGKYPVN